jgi:hypothetical protein
LWKSFTAGHMSVFQLQRRSYGLPSPASQLIVLLTTTTSSVISSLAERCLSES